MNKYKHLQPTSGFTQAGVYARRQFCAYLEVHRPPEPLWNPRLREAATTLNASFFQQIQAKIKKVNWKMYPERQNFEKPLWKKFVAIFRNRCEIEKFCLHLHPKIN